MPYIAVGQENSAPIQIHYQDHGSGRPVVLIHGFPLSGRAWERQERALLAAGYRVITYDRRGFGKSSQPVAGYDYDIFAADLDKLLTALDLHGVYLAGHSMGGGEIARYLGKYGPARVARAVIISGVPPYLLKTPETPHGVPQEVFDEIAAALTADRAAYFTEWNKNFFNTDETLGKLISAEAVQDAWNLAVSASPDLRLRPPPVPHAGDQRPGVRGGRAHRPQAGRSHLDLLHQFRCLQRVHVREPLRDRHVYPAAARARPIAAVRAQCRLPGDRRRRRRVPPPASRRQGQAARGHLADLWRALPRLPDPRVPAPATGDGVCRGLTRCLAYLRRSTIALPVAVTG
jgi:non-heme chloroperoxidase